VTGEELQRWEESDGEKRDTGGDSESERGYA